MRKLNDFFSKADFQVSDFFRRRSAASLLALLVALQVVTHLWMIDRICLFDEPTVARVLSTLKPDVHAKGTDYTVDVDTGFVGWNLVEARLDGGGERNGGQIGRAVKAGEHVVELGERGDAGLLVGRAHGEPGIHGVLARLRDGRRNVRPCLMSWLVGLIGVALGMTVQKAMDPDSDLGACSDVIRSFLTGSFTASEEVP